MPVIAKGSLCCCCRRERPILQHCGSFGWECSRLTAVKMLLFRSGGRLKKFCSNVLRLREKKKGIVIRDAHHMKENEMVAPSGSILFFFFLSSICSRSYRGQSNVLEDRGNERKGKSSVVYEKKE